MPTAASARPLTANYSKSFDEDDGHLMTVEEYLQAVASGCLMDDDGMGDVVRDGLYAEPASGDDGWPQWLRPSEGATHIPEDATHVLWYAK